MALVSALALVACSSDDPTGTGGGNGSFNANVTGGVTASFSGVAAQGEGPVEAGQSGWILALGDFATSANSIVVARLGTRPPNGTYQLIDLVAAGAFLPGDWAGFLFLGDGTTISYFGFSVSGTVTITSSSAELVEGTYDFQVSDGGQPPVVATVTGSFSAVGGVVNLPGARAGQPM
jgi:hypothetical protein